MILKRMKIKNFRQFVNEELNFDEEITVLAGANNSGKTSLVELFKVMFQNAGKASLKSFTKEDININFFENMKSNYTEHVFEVLKRSKSATELREHIKELLNNEKRFDPNAISVNIEVKYDKAESIKRFSDYLMELDDDNTSFYFSYTYLVNRSSLINDIIFDSEELFNKHSELDKIKKRVDNETNRKKIKEKFIEIEKKLLLRLFSNMLSEVYFTDKNYENAEKISVGEFCALFNFKCLKATRVLNDEKNDHYNSISKELLNHFKISDDWEEFKVNIIKDIKEGLDNRKLNEKMKEHSLKKTQKALNDIEKYFDYNKGEFTLQTDITDSSLIEFLSSSLRTFFEYKGGRKLKEYSQGLGVSNLIYICLRVESFVRQYKKDIVNLFIIEEPEAHMHPQMERTLIKFIKEILINEDENRVQGMITTHSNEIIKNTSLKYVRILRITNMLESSIFDMNKFCERLKNSEERQFYSFLFSINYSDLIFANKIIMYEGDTEKLYIEKLLTDDKYADLSSQYISFVQVGGAYSHWYRNLINYLKIKSLIITDCDYTKTFNAIDKIKNDRRSTNGGLLKYYKDGVTTELIQSEIHPFCRENCALRHKNCFLLKSEVEQVDTLQSDLRKSPCYEIKKPDYSIITKNPSVQEIDEWVGRQNHGFIKVATQGKSDSYTRTLEEAMLCKLFDITIETFKEKTWWSSKIDSEKLVLKIPKKKRINVRDILNENKSSKTDFMYSIILNDKHIKALPSYIEEGLLWLI